MTRRYVFVIGCARSGTTAMMDLLNTSANVCITDERFTKLWYEDIEHCSPALFGARRIVSVRETDSFVPQSHITEHRRAFSDKYRTAILVGDKAPRLHEHLDAVRSSFPKPRFIFMLRNVYDVCRSFEARADEGVRWGGSRRTEAGVNEWNSSLENAVVHMGEDIFVVSYEEFYSKGLGLNELVEFLDGVPADLAPEATYAGTRAARTARAARAAWAKRRPRIDEEAHFLIAKRARFDLYRELLARWDATVSRRAGQQASRNAV